MTTYHLNPTTGNPNVCRSKSCELEHFESKEAALAAKPEDRLTEALGKVKEELAKDKATTEAREESVVKTEKHLPETEAVAIADAVAIESEKPVVVETPVREFVRMPHVKQKKRVSAKRQAKNLAHEIAYQVEQLALVAPKHPLVKKTRKALKKMKKK